MVRRPGPARGTRGVVRYTVPVPASALISAWLAGKLTDAAVKDVFAAEPYHLALDEVLSPASDHHDYVRAIAKSLMLEESFVATTACRAYADARDAD